MKDISFRKARGGERDIVLSLLKEAALWLRDRGLTQWSSWLDPPSGLLRRFERGFQAGEFFMIERSGEVIGCFRLQWEDKTFWGQRDEPAGYVHSITIKRSLAGRGIGRRVLEMVEGHCQQNGKRYLRLDCDAGNPALEATVWGSMADPDGDGAVNLIEYFMALAPKVNDSGGTHVVSATTSTIKLRFRKSRSAVGLTHQVQWSNDLQPEHWSCNGVNETVADDSHANYQLIEASVPLGGSPKFLRLCVAEQ